MKSMLKNTVWFLSLFISFPLFSMDKEKKLSLLATLPVEIRDYIASFLELSTASYETDEFFKKRVLSSADNMIMITHQINQENQLPLNKTEKLKITLANSLVLETQGKLLQKYLIRSNTDRSFPINFYNLDNYYKKKFTPENQVDLCAISSHKKVVAALVNNKEIQVIPLKKTSEKTIFPLKTYFTKEGFAGTAETQEENKRYNDYGYFSKIEYTMYGYRLFLYSTNEKNNWHKPIRRLAISNDGKTIAFANKHQIFIADVDSKIYNKIHENSIIPIGPFNVNGQIFTHVSKEIETMTFNNQGSSLAIVYNPWHEAMADNIREDITYDEFLKNSYQNLYLNQKHLFTKEEQTRIESLLSKCPNNLALICNHIGKKVKNPENQSILKKNAVLIPVKKDALMLQEYFAKRGVCKDLNA